MDLGGPDAVSRDMLLAVVAARLREDLNFTAIQDTLSLLAESAAQSEADVARTLRLAQQVDNLITQRVAAGGVVSLPLAPGTEPGAGRSADAEEAQPVVAAIVTSAKGVLITRRQDGDPPWGFVAGKSWTGESPEHTALREVKEETGLDVRIGQRIGERNPHPRTGRHMIYLAAKPVRGTKVIVGDEEELAEVKWASLAEALERMPDMFGAVREYLAAEL